MKNLKKLLLATLSIFCFSTATLVGKATDTARLLAIFDEHASSARSVDALKHLDAPSIFLVEAIESASAPILVSTSAFYMFLLKREQLAGHATYFRDMDQALIDTIKGTSATYEELKKKIAPLKDENAFAGKRDELQNRLNKMFESKQGAVWSSHGDCFLAHFDPAEWIIKKVNQELVLLVPRAYKNCGNKSTTVDASGLSERERITGLKIDHLEDWTPTAILDEFHGHYAASWQFISALGGETESKIFVTKETAQKAGINPHQWQLVMVGHGFATDYAEYVELVRGAPYEYRVNGLKALRDGKAAIKLFTDTVRAYLQNATKETAQAAVDSLKKDATKAFDEIAYRLMWGSTVLQEKLMDLELAYINKNLELACQDTNHPKRVAELTKHLDELETFLSAMETLLGDSLNPNPETVDYQKGPQNKLLKELSSGRFIGLLQSHAVEALAFIDKQLQVQQLFYISCYSGGTRAETLLNKTTYHFPILCGCFAEAPAIGQSFQSYNINAIVDIEEGVGGRLVLPANFDFEGMFTYFAQGTDKAYIAGIDLVHPILPAHNPDSFHAGINVIANLPWIRKAGSDHFQMLMLDGTVRPLETTFKADATNRPVVYTLAEMEYDKVVCHGEDIPGLVSLKQNGTQYKIGQFIAHDTSFDDVASSFYCLQGVKKQTTIKIKSLEVNVDEKLLKLLNVPLGNVAKLQNVVFEIFAKKSKAGGRMHRISFIHDGQQYESSAECDPLSGFFSDEKLFKSLAKKSALKDTSKTQIQRLPAEPVAALA